MGKKKRSAAEIREEFLSMCAKGRPWLHWVYWMFGGDVRAQHPDHAKEPTIELLSEMLRNGDIVAGAPKGWYGFEEWDLSLEESIERIRREWDALERPPNHGDVAAFTMPEERMTRYRREHPKSAEEIEGIRGRADGYMKGLFAELEELPEDVAEWDQMGGYERDAISYDWSAMMIANDLIALEDWHREGLLTPEQEDRYERLKEALREARPMLEKIDVHPPSEVLE